MNVVELVVVVLTAILELSVASVISAGLSKTCDAFEKWYKGSFGEHLS